MTQNEGDASDELREKLDLNTEISEQRDVVGGLPKSSFPTFPSIVGPSMRSRSSALPAQWEPSMISRQSSWSSTSQRIEARLRRPFTKFKERRRYAAGPATPGPAPDDDAAQPRGASAHCSVDDILHADDPKESQLRYPQFDSLEPYCISEHSSISELLWREEATRLHHCVRNPTLDIQFKNRDYFKAGDEAGYKSLSTLAEKILTAISLCVLDNECINVQFCKQISNRSRLQKLIQAAQVASEADQGYEGEDLSHISAAEAEKRAREQNALFDLLNYVTAVLALLVTQTGAGKYWQASVLGALVKRVAKVKILLMDLSSNARVAAQNGESALDHSRDTGSNMTYEEEEECEEALRIIDAEAKDGLTSIEEAQVASYCVSQNQLRSGMNNALKSIVLSLRYFNVSGLPITSYEICGLVYETGFQGFKTLLYQDRNMEYFATSDLDNLNTANSAFNILEKTVRHLKQVCRRKDPPSNAGAETGVKTLIEWAYQASDRRVCETRPDGDQTQAQSPLDSLELEYMDDIITLMVPLATTNPHLVTELNNFRSAMLLSSENQELIRPYQETNFTAFFRLFTNKIGVDKTEADKKEVNTLPRGVLRLSAAFERGTFNRHRLIDPTNATQASRAGAVDGEASRRFEKLTRLMEDDWVTDETSIIVPCVLYVWTVAALSLLLAAGGIVTGFTVGARIEGVDPFNIATYTWVMAAFLILVCKSMLVSEWSWSDFLHCRVRCRSVSELEAVTGICDQLIIAKLLHDESGGGILVTRGPYNSVFLRRSKEFGFSIDRPVSTTTMFMSGLTPLQVNTPRGQSLVCLDARRGTQLRVVGHQAREEEYLVCEDVNRVQNLAREGNGAREKGKAVRLQLQVSKKVKWKRVIGVHDAKDVVFV